MRSEIYQKIDELLTNRGKLDPLAKDIAYLAGTPELEDIIIEKRIRDVIYTVLLLLTFGIRTHGSFSISTAVGMSEFGLSLGAELLLSNKMIAEEWQYYTQVYTHFFDEYYSIPVEIRRKLGKHLIESGIPEFNVNDHYPAKIVLNSMKPKFREFLATELNPLFQLIAAIHKLPLWILTPGLLLPFFGIPIGKKLKAFYDKLESEHKLLRGIKKVEAGHMIAQQSARLQQATAGINEQIQKYSQYYQYENLLGKLPLIFMAAGLLINRGKDAFGIFNYLSKSLQSLSTNADLIATVAGAQREAFAIHAAADFAKNSPYLLRNGHWDSWRVNEESYRTEPKHQTGEIMLEFEQFGATLPEVENSSTLSATLKRGHFYLLDAKSGTGKSIGLYALRGLIRHTGTARIRRNDTMVPITQLSRPELLEAISYFSTDGLRELSARAVDLFSNTFAEKKSSAQTNTEVPNSFLAMCRILQDESLERQLLMYWDALNQKKTSKALLRPKSEYNLNSSVLIPDWELPLFNINEITIEEFKAIVAYRDEKIEFARALLRKMGEHMDFEPTVELDKLSTGMMIRAHLASIINTGAHILILDEPLGALDKETVKIVMRESLQALLDSPQKFLVLMVSHPHQEIVEKSVREQLGDDKYHVLNLQ